MRWMTDDGRLARRGPGLLCVALVLSACSSPGGVEREEGARSQEHVATTSDAGPSTAPPTSHDQPPPAEDPAPALDRSNDTREIYISQTLALYGGAADVVPWSPDQDIDPSSGPDAEAACPRPTGQDVAERQAGAG